jgi:hypothetical protein
MSEKGRKSEEKGLKREVDLAEQHSTPFLCTCGTPHAVLLEIK